MKTAIIIHGYNDKSEFEDLNRPAASNDHWYPWLQRQLLLKGIEAQTPEMPGFYEPNYEAWKQMFERFDINEETILVGHSCGGGFLMRWLSENDTKVNKVVLVAPWIDPDHMIDPEFFNFKIDPNVISKTDDITIFYSTDDYPDVVASVEKIKSETRDIDYKEYKDKGHFVLDTLKSEKFPELLEIILN